MKTLITTLAIAFTINTVIAGESKITLKPGGFEQAVYSLEHDILKQEQISDLFKKTQSQSTKHIVSDYLVYKSEEGIPSGSQGGDLDFLEGAYSSNELIIEALLGREDYGSLGERIPYSLRNPAFTSESVLDIFQISS